jgi:DNA-binding transcriptional regulator YhcF (GntR family)
MDMLIQIDRENKIPLYMQLRNEIVRAVEERELMIGERLPTERELASDLEVSRKTVSHAYNMLEEEGVLVSYQGKGTFVSQEARWGDQQVLNEHVLIYIDAAIEAAQKYRISADEFLDWVRMRTREKASELSKE